MVLGGPRMRPTLLRGIAPHAPARHSAATRKGPAAIALIMALEAPGNAGWRGLIRQPDSTARAPPAANSSGAGCPECSRVYRASCPLSSQPVRRLSQNCFWRIPTPSVPAFTGPGLLGLHRGRSRALRCEDDIVEVAGGYGLHQSFPSALRIGGSVHALARLRLLRPVTLVVSNLILPGFLGHRQLPNAIFQRGQLPCHENVQCTSESAPARIPQPRPQ